jgi:hypothetical protein
MMPISPKPIRGMALCLYGIPGNADVNSRG